MKAVSALCHPANHSIQGCWLSESSSQQEAPRNKATHHTLRIEYLAREITQLKSSGIPLSSIAVLSRTNQEPEDVAAVLESSHLEYRSPEPIQDIYEHFIFTDIMAYLNLIDGNFRSDYLLRILNRPGRAI